MTGGKASEFRGRGLASGAWMGGRGRGRLKGHGVVRSGVNLDGVGVNPGESESSIFYYLHVCNRSYVYDIMLYNIAPSFGGYRNIHKHICQLT